MMRKTHWLAALMLAAGGTVTAWAGPGVGPYGPWNSGGAFGGFGPYQPYVVRGYHVQQGLGTAYVVRSGPSCAPVRMVRSFVTPAPVAETILAAPEPELVAERVTTFRKARCFTPRRTEHVITTTRVTRPVIVAERLRRPLWGPSRLFTKRCIPAQNLEVVGERIITTRPLRQRVITTTTAEPVLERVIEPSCNTIEQAGPPLIEGECDYANPYR